MMACKDIFNVTPTTTLEKRGSVVNLNNLNVLDFFPFIQ